MVIKENSYEEEIIKIDSKINSKNKSKRKNKYIPNLAEFYFEPDEDWSSSDALKLFNSKNSPYNEQIFYEDCINGMNQLPERSIDLIIADPPFGLDFNGKESIYNRNASFVVEGYKEITSLNYNHFTWEWISKLPRIMKNTASAFIFSGWTNLLAVLQAIQKAGLIVKNHIIWNYTFAIFTKRKFSSSHYHILYLVKDEKKAYFNRIMHYETDVWTDQRKYNPNQSKNGTKLPIDLIRKCINFTTKPGNLVLDPFLGNGTTAIAAKSEFRHYVGFEINENMKNIIESNLNRLNLGQDYKPYKERCPSIDTLKELYPKAYKIYVDKKMGTKNKDG